MENELRGRILELVKAVEPFDEMELNHKEDIASWIESGVEIFRIEKPATPSKHLVSYAVLVDFKEKKILLFDHKKALLLLPSGGHVDKNEMPSDCAKRELREELGFDSVSLVGGEVPFFVTVMETVGAIGAGHTDVNFWYVFEGDSNILIDDTREEFVREFDGYYWLNFEEVLSMPSEKFDPNMQRFVKKITVLLDEK